ncbi:divalent-cation tolerance protein CutA [bacterium]|nr:divalent-cation tolerance protein CutA [candidate division CSSED10-310 bacterium]
MEYCAVLVTAPSREIAMSLGRTLLEERLAACVQIVPGLTSLYQWQGKIQCDDELLMLIKTTAACFEALRIRIKNIHPYDLPQIVALPLAAGDEHYLDWLKDQVGPES